MKFMGTIFDRLSQQMQIASITISDASFLYKFNELLSHHFWVIFRFSGKGQFLDSLCRVTESISNDFVAWLSFVQFMMSRDFCDVVKTSRDNDFQHSAFVFVNAKWNEVSKKRLKRNYVFHSCLLTRDFNETQFTTHQSSFSQKCSKLFPLWIFWLIPFSATFSTLRGHWCLWLKASDDGFGMLATEFRCWWHLLNVGIKYNVKIM